MNYTLGSLFDGSGGFPLAGSLCGVEPRWASEVEPYPIAVTRERFPNMKHLGDISKINGAEIEPVDIITFGSPCQDLSVAGKRAGLKHEANGDEETTRSGLFMEAVRIIKEMRRATNGKYPRFALWENVPGAFSSNNGEDFRVVCEELIKIVEPAAFMPSVPQGGWAYADSYIGDGWSLAYRVFDAQYWGVPQRRRRIHLIADFRGECAREVLFEREGLRGYFAEGRTPWQTTATDAEDCAGADDRKRTDDADLNRGDGRGLDELTPILDSVGGQAERGWEGTVAPTLKATHYKCPPLIAQAAGFCTEHSAQARGIGYQEEVAPTLRAGVTPAVMYTPKAYSFDSLASNSMKSSNPHGGCREVEVSKTLDTSDPNPSKNQGGIAVVECYDARGNGDGQTVNTLTGDHNNRVTDYTSLVCMATQQGGAEIRTDGKAPTLTAAAGMSGNNQPVICLQGNAIDRADTAGCNGKGWKEDTAYTLNTIDRPAVAYAMDVGFFNGYENQSPTLLARQYKDPHLVAYPEDEVYYIVRRLTPTECARLQGFADWWAYIEPKKAFTPEDFAFWHEVRNTHATINSKTVKEYTEAQMLTWYNKLYTDSAEYKMWGNGIALPPALYCMQGIVDALNTEAETEEDEAWML